MHTPMRRRRGLALQVLVATVIAGALSAAGAAGAPAGAATPAPLVVGDICSCTGPEASTIAQTSPTAQAWASSVNAEGGIDGHKVDVIVKDDAYNPTTSLAEAQTLVEQDHVVAIMDNSDEDQSWAPYVKQQEVPVLGDTDTVAGYTNSDFYTPGLTFNNATPGEVAAMKRAGVKKVADLYYGKWRSAPNPRWRSRVLWPKSASSSCMQPASGSPHLTTKRSVLRLSRPAPRLCTSATPQES